MRPAAFGGSDASLADVMLLVGELGRAGFPGPYIATAIVATLALREAGSRAQQERLLPGMALGERICTIAVAEESGSFDPAALVLRGESSPILDRDVAERMAKELPRGRFVEIPRAVHTLHEDNPDAVLAALKDFLAF